MTERGIPFSAPLKAISVIQPWGYLMFHGIPLKDIENRTWPLPHYLKGRRACIHASAKRSLDEWCEARLLVAGGPNSIRLPFVGTVYSGGRHTIKSWPDEFVTSAIIGTVEIVDCVTASDSPWFVGPYGFVLRDPIALPKPIPCRGALGFWNVPEKIAEAVRRAA